MKNRAVTRFVEHHLLRLLWLSNDSTHGCLYVSAFSLFLVVCAVICGSEGWSEIEDFVHSKLDFLRQYGNFTGGIPSQASKFTRLPGHH